MYCIDILVHKRIILLLFCRCDICSLDTEIVIMMYVTINIKKISFMLMQNSIKLKQVSNVRH